MATIRDVARLAGVSTSTVSNVLNNNLNITQEKYDRVVKAMETLNYRPSILARNLKHQNAFFVAVILPSYEGKYASILRGLHSVVDGKKYQLISKITDNDIQVEHTILEELLSIGVSGIIIEPSNYLDHEQYLKIARRGIPIIFLEREIEGYGLSSVVFDDYRLMISQVKPQVEKYSFSNLYLIRGNRKISVERKYEEGFYQICKGKKDFKEEEFEKHQIECSFNQERAIYTLCDKISLLEQRPKCFIVTSIEIAKVLWKVLDILRMEAEIYTFFSDEHGTEASGGGRLHYISRKTVELGIRSGKLMQEWLNNPAIYEGKRIIVEPEENVEKLELSKSVITHKKIKLLLLDAPVADAIQKLKVGFEKDYHCEVELEIKKYNEIRHAIQEEIRLGSAEHDIWMVDLPWFHTYVEQNSFYDMSQMIRKDRKVLDDYPSRILNVLAYKNGRFWGWPIMASVQLLFYRKDLFENSEIKYSFLRDMGFELQVPNTWKEFNIIAKYFTQSQNAKSPVKYGTAICQPQDTGLVDEFLMRGGMTGTLYFNSQDEKILLDKNKALFALENLKECSNYTSYTAEEDYWWDVGFEQLLAGNLAMLAGFSSMFPVYSKATHIGQHYNSIGVAPVPGGKPVLGGWSLCINNASEKAEQAFAFIRWLTAAERRKTFLLLGGFAPSISVLEDASLNISMSWLKSNLEAFSSGEVRKMYKKADGTSSDQYENDMIIAKNIRKVISGECKTAEALSQIEQEMGTLKFI